MRRYALGIGAASPTGEAIPQALRSNSKLKTISGDSCGEPTGYFELILHPYPLYKNIYTGFNIFFTAVAMGLEFHLSTQHSG
jgi:hypothetical protein